MAKKLRLLLIAYQFPPYGGPASIRVGKLAKYFLQFGWKIDVISVKNILYHSFDPESAEECRSVRLYRVNSFEIVSLLYYLKKFIHSLMKTISPKSDSDRVTSSPSVNSRIYFSLSESTRSFIKRILPPDEKIGWYPQAYRHGLKLIKKERPDFILASIGPYTAGLVAYKLSKKTDVPLVLDYRDHWSLNPYERFLTPLHRYLADFWERKLLERAVLVSTVGETMQHELINNFPEITAERTTVIYNGYDEEDYMSVEKTLGYTSMIDPESSKIITLTYAGNFYLQRTPQFFINALKKLKSENRLPSNLRIKFIGNYHKDMLNILSDKELSNQLEIIPQIPHCAVLKEMLNSDVLLLFISIRDGKGVLTSKVFEYLRADKPILAMIPPDSEIALILERHKKHFICPMEDEDQIQDYVVAIYQKIRRQNSLSSNQQTFSNNRDLIEFSRERQFGKLNHLLVEKLNVSTNINLIN